MKILKAGTKVRTVIGSIEAFITGVYIEVETIEYRIRYFSLGEEKTALVFRFEIEPISKKREAGFNKIQKEEENPQEIYLIESSYEK